MTLKFLFSHDIYHARTELKLTQQYVSNELGISLREYQKIEKGETLPRAELFLRIIFYFELDIENYREEVLAHVPVYTS